MLTANEIRQKYLDFFKEKGHEIIPSAPVVPENDPTVLFTTAGMHPLVPYLMGEKHPKGQKLVNSQKCIRTVDIDEVGDNRHLTFFEMLGNWSLGSYFKKEAIEWSWEFMTDEKWLGLNPERIYVTVFAGDKDAPQDNESIEIWKKQFKKAGIEAETCEEKDEIKEDSRIFLLGKEDNWWGPAGETGPCGPDTEMFYKVKPEKELKGTFEEAVDNFEIMEIWNDVFMEYEKKSKVILVDGMNCLYGEDFKINQKLLNLLLKYKTKKILVVNGFGEKAKELLGKDNIDVFTFKQKLKKDNKDFFIKLLKKYNLSTDKVLYIEHSQNNLNGAEEAGIKNSKIFALGDNIEKLKNFLDNNIYFFEKLQQKNVDTGMGLERIVTVLNGKENVFETELFLPIMEKIEGISGKKYDESKEIKKSMRIIADHIKASVFIIADGVDPSNTGQGYVLRRLIRRAIREGKRLEINDNFVLKIAKVVQEMYKDVYPEVSNKKILEVLNNEEDKFRKTLEKGLKKFKKVTNKLAQENRDLILQEDGSSLLTEDSNLSGKDIFDLYTESGFPKELIKEEAKNRGIGVPKKSWEEFEELFKKHQELSRTASAGMFKGGLADNKEKTTQLHTVAHLMLAGLRKVLGGHVHQKGSNINGERIRFDFSHPEKMTEEEKKQVEDFVNEAIEKKVPVEMEEMSLEEAKKSGAEGAFENKYGDQVKVYNIEDSSADSGQVISKEICGGPHVKNTSEIKGKFKIQKEKSSSAGVRRIKAILE